MSTFNGATEPPIKASQKKNSGIPWVPVVAFIGVAAVAIFLVKKFKEADEAPRLETALDQCDRAANALDERLQDVSQQLAS